MFYFVTYRTPDGRIRRVAPFWPVPADAKIIRIDDGSPRWYRKLVLQAKRRRKKWAS